MAKFSGEKFAEGLAGGAASGFISKREEIERRKFAREMELMREKAQMKAINKRITADADQQLAKQEEEDKLNQKVMELIQATRQPTMGQAPVHVPLMGGPMGSVGQVPTVMPQMPQQAALDQLASMPIDASQRNFAAEQITGPPPKVPTSLEQFYMANAPRADVMKAATAKVEGAGEAEAKPKEYEEVDVGDRIEFYAYDKSGNLKKTPYMTVDKTAKPKEDGSQRPDTSKTFKSVAGAWFAVENDQITVDEGNRVAIDGGQPPKFPTPVTKKGLIFDSTEVQVEPFSKASPEWKKWGRMARKDIDGTESEETIEQIISVLTEKQGLPPEFGDWLASVIYARQYEVNRKKK